MSFVYVKIENARGRHCFRVWTAMSATRLHHEVIKPFITLPGTMITCLRKHGAQKYGWDIEAER